MALEMRVGRTAPVVEQTGTEALPDERGALSDCDLARLAERNQVSNPLAGEVGLALGFDGVFELGFSGADGKHHGAVFSDGVGAAVGGAFGLPFLLRFPSVVAAAKYSGIVLVGATTA